MSEFEKFVKYQGFNGDFQRGCNGQYKSDLLHFMEKAFTTQQAKIDCMQVRLDGANERALSILNHKNRMVDKMQAEIDELQKRIDEALKSADINFWNSSTVKDMVDILKGNKDEN